MFQFTRPRGGATSRTCNLSANAAVSIHAPARGATQGGHQGRRVIGRFNSRAREGRDCCISGKIASARVSIHAPARGATALGRLPFVFRKFQFTRPRGARLREPRRVRFDLAFQFTRPRGARRPPSWRRGRRLAFQFTRPRGARRISNTRLEMRNEFQFTRPRGARRVPPLLAV